MLKQFFFIATLLFPAVAQSQSRDTLVFATYRYADNNRIRNIEPFAKYFGGIIRNPVTVKSYNSVQELIDGMKKGETDIVFINTFGYLLLREQSRDYSIAAALHIPVGTRSTYQTAIVASTRSKITTLDDLTKTPSSVSLLLVNPGSTSGNLIPRIKLADVGIGDPERAFKSVNYTKNHALTLKHVIDGIGDVGAFGSEEYYKSLAADPNLQSQVNLLWESGPIQLGPVLFSKKISKRITDELLPALLTLHEKNRIAFEAIKAGWTEAIPADRFESVDDGYYDEVLHSNREAAVKIIKTFAQ